MNNKLVLFCLLICPLSFASKPLPAAGAGAGRDLPTVAAAQAAVPQQSAAQVDIKQLHEQQKKDSATIARLAAELEALKLQMDKDKEKSKKEWFCSWNCKLNGNNEWTEELVMKAKDSDKFLILTSIYYFEKENLSVNNAFYNRMFNVKTTGINCAKSVTGDEKLSLVVNAMNFRVLCLFNGLLDCRAIDDLDGIITGNGACEMTL